MMAHKTRRGTVKIRWENVTPQSSSYLPCSGNLAPIACFSRFSERFLTGFRFVRTTLCLSAESVLSAHDRT